MERGGETSVSVAGRRGVRDWVRRPVAAGLILLAVYVALSFLNSPRGFLGTDTGGKVATLVEMDRQGDLTPEVGYWAAAQDPTARVHGLYYTSVVNGHFVNVTSVPMILAADPLWRAGGYRAALLLPMLGAVAAAFAARAIARRVGSVEGWGAFWLVGLASPMVIYALDLWEHTLGVALMAWAAVWLFDAVEEPEVRWRGLAAGLALGAAFAMRSEAATYALGFLAVACLARWRSKQDLKGAVGVGVTAVVGFALMAVANAALELAVLGGTIRTGRATGTVSGGGSEAALRIKEAIVTSLSPFPTLDPGSYVLAIGLTAALAYLVWGAARRREPRVLVIAAGLVGFLYVARIASGLGFVPGLVAATPLAVAGLVWGWGKSRARLVVLLATVPLPLVFAFQFPGGAAPQWAGRYILTSGLLLAAVGAASLASLERWVATFLVVLSVVITIFGVAWLSLRSHDVARAADVLESRQEDVLISPNGFVPREFGASYGRKQWLSAGCTVALEDCDDLIFATEVARDAGASTFGLVSLESPDPPPAFDGWVATGPSESVPFVAGTDLHVTTYARQAQG